MSTATVEPGTIGVVETAPTPAPQDPGDHDRFSHYVNRAVLTDATIFGFAVTALCGKKWVPTKDPKRFPVCPACKDLWEKKDVPDDGDPRDDL